MRVLLLPFAIFLSVTMTLVGCDSTDSVAGGNLVIEDITVGTGDMVEAGQAVIVSYIGMLEDGTVFDSSEEQGENLIFTAGVGQAIEGLDIGILGMRTGGTRRLSIPSHLAFGRSGMCTSDGECRVPANANVIFEITLVDIMTSVIVEDLVVGPDTALTATHGRTMIIDYVGTFINGTIFDATQFRGTFFEFRLGLGEVIEGLDDGIAGMRVGGVRLITIPSILAYGEFGSPPTIPAWAILKFRVDLIGVI